MTTTIDRSADTRLDPAPATSDPASTSAAAHDPFAAQVRAVERWMAQPRFDGLVRLHTARDVAEQQGTIPVEHAVARESAQAFFELLRRRFDQRGRITTFGPYTPGQAVTMKRRGLEAIYLGGWATSAKGSADEDPGPDLASYPLSAVPEEAAGIVRALLTADRDQHFRRSRLPARGRATAAVDYRPFIIADADTGHGGDAHVRNLIRRFVEVGVPGYHIEDQRPGAKKCGHQDGKVLVAQAEQNKRLNAARLQLDIMGVPGIIVARTDAEAATLLDDASDERDQPFVLGATRRDVPSYRVGYLAILRLLHESGLVGIRGHLLAAVPEAEQRAAVDWLAATGIVDGIRARVASMTVGDGEGPADADGILAEVEATFAAKWSSAAGLSTFDEAVAVALERRVTDGEAAWSDLDEWRRSSGTRSFAETRAAARAMGVDVEWDPDLPRTPDGFYRVAGGIDYAIAKSLAAAPFADLLWMETKTADLEDARRFAEAIHAVHPGKMLAYNLSPSFNWDTTGMTDDEMRAFPDELGRLGFVFQFITYGGHQIDGLVTEDFANDLQRDGMLALARLQRRLRLIDSPYRAPQALVGGPRLDAALMAASGRTASTAAMGVRSTHHQHLVATETDVSVLRGWLAAAQAAGRLSGGVEVSFGPASAQSERTVLALGPATSPGGSSIVSLVVPSRSRTLVVESASPATAGDDAAGMVLALLFLLARERPDRLLGVDPGLADHPALHRLEHAGALGAVAASEGVVAVASVDVGCVAGLADLAPEALIRAVLPD